MKQQHAFGYPTTVEVFSDTGFLQGAITLPIPGADDFEDKELTVVLNEGANLQGSITDPFGKPLAGVKVIATPGSGNERGGQQWQTETRNDGMFRLAHIPAAGNLVLSVDRLMFETLSNGSDLIEIKDDREIGSTMYLEPLECLDLRDLAQPIEPLTLEFEDPEQDLAAIREYIAEQLARIPEKPLKYRSRVGTADPISTFRSKVLATVLEQLKRLSAKHAGTDFEFRLLQQVASAYRNHGQLAVYGDGERRAREWVFEQLLANHADREEAFVVLESEIRQQGMAANSRRMYWKKLAEATNLKEVKQVAYYQAAWGAAVETSNRLQHWADDDDFGFAFDELVSMLGRATEINVASGEARTAFVENFVKLAAQKERELKIKEADAQSQSNATVAQATRTFRERLEKMTNAVKAKLGTKD